MQGPSKNHRLPNAASNRMNFVIALWHLGAVSHDTSVTFAAIRGHMSLDESIQFAPKFVQGAKQAGLVATFQLRTSAYAYLTQEGIDTLKQLEKLGRVTLERKPAAPTSVNRDSVVAGASDPFIWPRQSDSVRTCCHGYVAGGAVKVPAVERAEGLVFRTLPSRRGDTLVYPDGRTEPMPAEGPWPAIKPKLLRAWDLEQVAQADAQLKAA